MCLYHRAALGYLLASGAEERALKTATSAWEALYLCGGVEVSGRVFFSLQLPEG